MKSSGLVAAETIGILSLGEGEVGGKLEGCHEGSAGTVLSQA